MRATWARTSSTVMSSDSSTRGEAFLAQQPEQDVLRPDVVVLERARVLSQDDHLSCPLGKALEHRSLDAPFRVSRPTPVGVRARPS